MDFRGVTFARIDSLGTPLRTAWVSTHLSFGKLWPYSE